MDARKIVVISTRDQKKSVITSGAETLSELKADLTRANIDYEGLTFYEGLSKTELMADDSILPRDINYKGKTTNELVFMLTNPNKKISSGAGRKELYSKITKELAQKCIELYGKNYTLCSNAQLEELVTKKVKVEKPEAVKPVCKKDKECTCKVEEMISCILSEVRNKKLNIAQATNMIIKELKNKKVSNSSYTEDEIDNMFDFVNR